MRIVLLVVAFLLVAGCTSNVRDMDAPLKVIEPPSDCSMAAYFIDVGQGDSEYLVFPNGHTLLIDTGTGRTAANNNIAKVVQHIDTILITHDHADHTGGLEYIETHYNTGGILTYSHFTRGMKLHPDDTNVTVDILNPVAGWLSDDENDRSVVLKVAYHNVSFLFTGDIGSGLTENSLQSGHIDILKVAHHGSSSSTSGVFLNLVKPRVAIISVGQNSYGHPSQDTLQRLEGIRTYRTDESGTIRVCTDGNSYNVTEMIT